jgi:hypothetical protein
MEWGPVMQITEHMAQDADLTAVLVVEVQAWDALVVLHPCLLPVMDCVLGFVRCAPVVWEPLCANMNE